MKITRELEWRSRLHAWAASQTGRPLIWGETDCGALARQALATMFGREVLPSLPAWESALQATRVQAAHGPMGIILAAAGADVVPLAFMRAGDIVVHEDPEEAAGREAAFVCLDGRHCIGSTKDGVRQFRIELAAEDCVVYSLWELVVDG